MEERKTQTNKIETAIFVCVYMYVYIHYIYGAERESGREGRIFFNNKDINHGLEDI